MIYVSDNKSILCKGDYHPAQFYKGKKKIAGYEKVTIEGERTTILENCYNDRLHNAKIYGDTIQDGEPSPEAPVEMQSVGDLVTEGEHAGKYRINVVARGKNLLKAPLDINSWGKKLITSANYSYNLGKILPLNETVTLSFDYTTIPAYFYFLTDDESVTTVPYSDTSLNIKYLVADKVQNVKLTFTPKEGKSYYLHNAMTENNTSKDVAQAWLDRFTYIQIEYGNEATEYEEYKEPQIFDIYLNEPLRKVGRYEDYIDFEDKTVVRNTVLKTFEGTETWYREKFRVYTVVGGPSVNSLEICLMTDKFEAYSWEQLYTNVINGNKYIGAAQQPGYICITPATVVPTVDEWKAQLALWKSEEKPLTVVYAGNTVKENISLPEIPTFKGTTVYEIDTQINAKINGEYKKMEE